MPIALINCRLIDGTTAPASDGMTVVLRGERIFEVSRRRDFPPGTTVADLGGRIVMPGLIDCHVHFALWSMDLLSHRNEHLSYLAATTYRHLREALESGCTSARDPGGLDIGFREAIEQRVCPGPRLQTSVVTLTSSNGIGDISNALGVPVPRPPGMPDAICNGPDETRAAVRRAIGSGADFIKVAASGGVNSARRGPRDPGLDATELAAAVEEAHSWGRAVACHAIGGYGTLAAVRAGIDSLEHGAWLDDECLDEMAERGTWYVPTLSAYALHRELGGPMQRSYAEAMEEPHLDTVARAKERGVRIACGSDSGTYGFDFTREYELLVTAGLTPSEAIAAGTTSAAACLGWSDFVGTVAEGLMGDLLVLSRDPTADITVLQDRAFIDLVIKGGEVVVGGL